MSEWKKGQLVWVESDPSLGPVLIVGDAHPQLFETRILANGERRNFTRRQPPFRRVVFHVGQRLRVRGAEAPLEIRSLESVNGVWVFRTESGVFTEADVLEIPAGSDVLDVVRRGTITRAKAFWARETALDLLRRRESHPLRGAVGCRVQLMPHQLWVMERVLREPRIRALLADEVGLGKTIEAGLIFSALHARGELKRVLVLVPPALKVQWLTEGFRRFNVRFRLDHEELIDEGEHRDFVIASFDEIDRNEGPYDLVVVDEAHRLVRDRDYSDELEALVESAKHVLFLSATPRAHGEAALAKLLATLELGGAGPALVFRSERAELGLPTYRRLEAAFTPDKEAWLLDFFAARFAASAKPEKVFLIVSKADEVVRLEAKLRRKFGDRFAAFHERMDLVERDRQAAYFADPDGAPVLLSSEIGGEGRNFQFCHEMLLFDLPEDPLVVEQRIGRLDRIGQTREVRVWCPVLEDSPEEAVFERLRDVYRVFEEPWSGSSLSEAAGEELLSSRRSSQPLVERRVPFDPVRAAELVREADALARTWVRPLLGEIYDLFGVEVEDVDSLGTWRVQASSLMFVEAFPGLGRDGERLVTFDRARSLAREDLVFLSVDHPDVVETLEFLLASHQGAFAVARATPGERAASFVALLREAGPDGMDLKAYSLPEGSERDFEGDWRESDDLGNVVSLSARGLESLAKVIAGSARAAEPAIFDAILLVLPS